MQKIAAELSIDVQKFVTVYWNKKIMMHFDGFRSVQSILFFNRHFFREVQLQVEQGELQAHGSILQKKWAMTQAKRIQIIHWAAQSDSSEDEDIWEASEDTSDDVDTFAITDSGSDNLSNGDWWFLWGMLS